ncbi:MAG: FlgD immunoglobulin-like domain containing protein [bacterium]
MHRYIGKIVVLAAVILAVNNVSAEIKNFSFTDGKVSYTLTESNNVTIQLFTPGGELISTLFAGEQKKPGEYSFQWDSKDREGHLIKKGRYLLKAGVGRKAVKDANFAKTGFIQMQNPGGLVIDKNGDLYILDIGVSESGGYGLYEKWLKPAGLYKFTADGAPINDFYPSESNFHGLPRGWHRWIAMDDTNLYCSLGGTVNVMEKTGRIIRTVDGGAPSQGGGALGADSKLYTRVEGGHEIYVCNRSLEKGFLFKTPSFLPGAFGIPTMIADGRNGIYLTAGPTMKLEDKGTNIVLRYQYPTPDTVQGLALSQGMIYVVDRSPASNVYQLWDTGESLLKVAVMGDDSIKGLHAIAVSPDGKSLYLLEDGMDQGKGCGKGAGRLFKYDLGYAQEAQANVTLSGEAIHE